MSLTERQALVERESTELTLTSQAELLSISRSSLYYQPAPPSAEEIAIKHRLDELYTQHPFYGSRKMAWLLKPTWAVNRKRVQRYMQEMGLVAIFSWSQLKPAGSGA